MKTRIIAGILLAPPFLYITWLGGLPFQLLIGVISLVGMQEYFSILKSKGQPGQEWLTYLWVLGLNFAARPGGEPGVLTVAALAPLFLILKYLGNPRIEEGFHENARSLFGFYTFAFPFVFLTLIREASPEHGRIQIFLLLALVWIQDSAAYFGGKALGRHKLQPYLSPKKTWEGSIIGLVLGVGLPVAYLALQHGVRFDAWLIGGLLMVAIAAQLGDLNESLFKRNLDVKDSGSLIPGHGGILDRFDSFTFAAPVMYYVVKTLWPA